MQRTDIRDISNISLGQRQPHQIILKIDFRAVYPSIEEPQVLQKLSWSVDNKIKYHSQMKEWTNRYCSTKALRRSALPRIFGTLSSPVTIWLIFLNASSSFCWDLSSVGRARRVVPTITPEFEVCRSGFVWGHWSGKVELHGIFDVARVIMTLLWGGLLGAAYT